MKKIVLSMVAMMSMTMAFASESEKTPEVTATNMVQNYDMRVNYRTLASTLDLNDYQMEAVELIHNKFVNEMKNAETADAAVRQDMVKKAADKELQFMSYVLDGKQYDKYAKLLNLTLNNRGLLK
ncbi:MAG: hypothetical protein I3J02_03850 [Prevotella sp.]|nr:hypothetical protein [Prevotella sp.]